MELERASIERILRDWPVARLGTVSPSGAPQLVPIVFTARDGVLWTPIDGKPKRAGELARVRNVRRDPRVSVLLDHYDADWTALWWLRLDGRAEVVGAASADARAAADGLRAKYPRYASGVTPLSSGEPRLIRIAIERSTSWSAGS